MTADEIAAEFGLDAAEIGELLARARRAHDDALARDAEFRDANERARACKPEWARLRDRLRDALDTWEGMTVDARDAITWLTDSGARIVEPVDQTLRRLLALTTEAETLGAQRGRPVGLPGLHALAAVLRPFWERATGTLFVHDDRRNDPYMGAGVDGPRDPPYNYAQDFLLACVEHLGYRYTETNCVSVLKRPQN